jgi:Arc/MetJ family transcription regulator
MPAIEPARADVYVNGESYTSESGMRTNIEIDDELMKQAMAATGLPTKKAVVEEGLRRLVQFHRQYQALQDLRGIAEIGDDYKQRRRLPRHLDPRD